MEELLILIVGFICGIVFMLGAIGIKTNNKYDR